MNSELVHDPWIHDDDIFPSTYASLKDAAVAANVAYEIEKRAVAKMASDFPNGANCGPYLRVYLPMGREWERIALEILAHIHAASIRPDGTVFIHGEIYQTRKDGGGGASIEPESRPGLNHLRAAHPELLAKPGVCAVLRVLLSDPDKLWSVPALAGDEAVLDALHAGRADARSVRRWLKELHGAGLACQVGRSTAKRWRLSTK